MVNKGGVVKLEWKKNGAGEISALTPFGLVYVTKKPDKYLDNVIPPMGANVSEPIYYVNYPTGQDWARPYSSAENAKKGAEEVLRVKAEQMLEQLGIKHRYRVALERVRERLTEMGILDDTIRIAINTALEPRQYWDDR